MITTILIILGLALAFVLLLSGYLYLTGDHDAQIGMSFLLFFGLAGIAQLAVLFGILYSLYALVRWIF